MARCARRWVTPPYAAAVLTAALVVLATVVLATVVLATSAPVPAASAAGADAAPAAPASAAAPAASVPAASVPTTPVPASVAAVTGGAPAEHAAPALVPAGTNLLVDPGAEVGECSRSGLDATTVPGWSAGDGSPDSVCYGAPGFPASGPPGAGHALFAGGATGNAMLSQRVDVSGAFHAIVAGDVEFTMTAWLGGFAGQDDRVGVRLEFDDAGSDPLSVLTISPVTNTDRSLATGLVRRDLSGLVPAGTRSVLVSLSFTWTAGETTDGYADDLSFALTTASTAPVLRVPDGSMVPSFAHVFVVFLGRENYGGGEQPAGAGDYIVHNPAAGYLNRVVAAGGALLSEMYATTHPGDPDGLAVTGGSTFGWSRDLVAGTDQVAGANIADRLEADGKSWAAYADGMAYSCDTTEHDTAAGGYYRPDADPFLLYADIARNPIRCATHDRPGSSLAADLGSARTTPALVWVAPNDRDNMDQGGVAAGDAWLATTVPLIMRSPAWTKQRSLLIVSWEQGYAQAYGPDYANHVATYVLASQGLVKQGYVSPLRYGDYSLGATIERALGIGALTGNDRYAAPLSDIWTSNGRSGGIPPDGQI